MAGSLGGQTLTPGLYKGTTSSFQGTVLAHQSISMDTGATLDGRVMASVAAVTMLSNTVVNPTP